jgi:hypothetical protein
MMKICKSVIRAVAIAASAGLLSGNIAAAELNMPVNTRLTGMWASSESSERGRLEASLKPVGDGEYELWFKVTGSSVFNPAGKPYPDEGIYPLQLERTGENGLSFTYRQPYPRIPALFFVPNRLTYRVRLEGAVNTTGTGRWTATVSDHNLALSLWVKPGSIAGTYDYDGRWASAAGAFKLTADPRARPDATNGLPKQDSSTTD